MPLLFIQEYDKGLGLEAAIGGFLNFQLFGVIYLHFRHNLYLQDKK